MRCNSTTKIVGRTDIDVAIDEFEKINVPHAATLSLRSFGASGDTLRPVVSGWPATRNPQGEGWRWKQSAVYRSQGGFPCYQGINWENFAILGCWTARNTN
jgi:hypothetical protein